MKIKNIIVFNTLKKYIVFLFLIGVLLSCASDEVVKDEIPAPTKPELTPIEVVNIAPPKGKTYKNSLGIEFVLISAGEFQMGCSKGDTDCDDNEKSIHTVKIPKPFYMGKFEVTQGQWTKLMGNNPSKFKDCGEDCPVEQVSWNDSQEFIERLCTREKHSPCKYRLPTEAEWEYAARVGTKTKYDWGDSMDGSYAWYDLNSGMMTHPVGKKKPNAWGLYDMTGNVWEWCEDWYNKNYYKNSPSADPKGANSGERRSLRGGSWNNYAGGSRLSGRGNYYPDGRDSSGGFRLVLLP